MIRHKNYFDNLVALEGGLRARDVRHITTAFLSKIVEALVEEEIVVLEGFGRFRIKESAPSRSKVQNLASRPVKGQKAKTKATYKVTRVFRVHFKKSETFNRLLRLSKGPSGHKEK